MTSEQDISLLEWAIELAKKGTGFVAPNPLVGAIIVKNGEIIGEGFHEKYGEHHAEIHAILNAEKNGHDVTGSTMYVTLEPCAHTGKTPSCARLLAEKKIKKVIIANRDPNPKAGGGIEILKKTEIEVEILEQNNSPSNGGELEKAILAKKARAINKGFFALFEKNRPFFTAKVAISKNGMVAEAKGKRTQITGEKAQIFTHQLRMECDAILVGAETIAIDNPELSVRYGERKRDPLRIIFDPNNRIPKDAKVFRDTNIWHVTEKIDLKKISKELTQKGILRVLIEGGPKTIESFLKKDLIDELYLIQSPKNLPKTGIPLFPNGFPKGFIETEKKKLGEDVVRRYVFEENIE